jgi:Flp pilus assembly protein TadD
MKIRHKKLWFIQISVLVLFSGCASTPDTNSDTVAHEGLNDDSLDVLFATEFPVESEEDALTRAEQALAEGETDEALFYFVRALQFRPDNVDLLMQIAEIQMRRQDFALAKRAFLITIQHDPNRSGALEGLGLIYMDEGRDEEAVSNLTSAVANDERLWRAHNALGVYADKAADYPTALQHYNLALSINPEAAYVRNNRGYSKYLAGDIEGAMLDLYTAANDWGFLHAWANLGKIYAEEGMYRDAIKTYKLVMSEASALNNTGYSAIENGDLLLAERYLNKAIRLSPTYFPSAEENLSLLQELQLR